MAIVTVTFEDVDEGVKVKIESDPGFPNTEPSEEMTQAQEMGLRMAAMLTEELDGDEHECGPNCDHEHPA